MRTTKFLGALLTLVVAASLAAADCANKESAPPAASAEATTPKPAGDGKIPITTSSDAAKAEYLQGRNLVDNLQITDSIAHFKKAIELDPNFALAELSLSGASPTGTEFFEHLNKAVALADKVSNGEKLLILVAQAGANGNVKGQKEYLDQLLVAYPNDERARFAMGGYYFGQTEYPQAIEHYKKATELSPNYASAFNLLGYAYRQNVNYPEAEKAFQRYIELIPKDPNPYDSYAELLLKMGRFDDAIVQYRKALEIDPNFLNAHQGIGMALLYQGKPDQALAEIDNIGKKARTDGERRTGMFAASVVHIDNGKLQKALQDAEAQYELGKKTNDVGAMAFDKGLMGAILLEMGKPDQAKKEYEAGVALVQASNLLNLVLNAADAVSTIDERERRVMIRTEAVDSSTRILVADNGPGIPPDNLKRLFEPFWSTKPAGLGMGLAICHSIVTTHHGSLTASNGPGAGATFCVTLPSHHES